jgi:hypothetical protein
MVRDINYNDTVIYKIICANPDIKDCYVGQTANFKQRKRAHKTICRNINSNSHNIRVYKTIRENGGWENWTMIEIEKFPCTNEREATARERYWMERLESNLNSILPQITNDEIKLNKSIYIKEYYELNKDNLLSYQKTYREENDEKIIERSKNYYIRKRNEILTKQGEIKICGCGKQYTKNHMKRHLNSNFHQNYEKNII